MTDQVDVVNSYTTFRTQFSATLLQAEAALYSEIFDVEIDFVWSSSEIAMGNAAFLKLKYFLEETLHQSIFTHKAAPVTLSELENNIVIFSHVPTSDIIAMTLHSKLNAITRGYIEVVSVKLTSKFENPSMSFTYSDDIYPALPSLEDWIGQKKYYYTSPWWGRNSPETIDYDVDENTDLTQPPEYDNVLDEIEQVVLGELKLKESGGEVIDINVWKPEIVKD